MKEKRRTKERGKIKGGGERNGKEIKEITREEGGGMKEQRDERVYKTKKMSKGR